MMTMPSLMESAVTPRNDAVSTGAAVVPGVDVPVVVDLGLLLLQAASTNAAMSSATTTERFRVMHPPPVEPGSDPGLRITVRPNLPAIHDSRVRFVTVT